MIHSIQATSAIKNIGALESLKSAQRTSSASDFSKIIGNMVDKVDSMQNEAENTVQNFAAGKADFLQVVMGLNKADLSLKMAVEVRNKAVEAYQEIMRMSI